MDKLTLKLLMKVAMDYKNNIHLIESLGFVVTDIKIQIKKACYTDVYQLSEEQMKGHHFPYIVYHECLENINSISLETYISYNGIIHRLIEEALIDGFKEIYDHTYHDGSFDKTFHSGDYTITYSSQLSDNDKKYYVFNFMCPKQKYQ